MTALAPTEITLTAEHYQRLRAIERAAWHALEMAREGRPEHAYAILSEALDVIAHPKKGD